MATRLSISTSLNKPYLNSSAFEDEPVYALLELHPTVETAPGQRSPLNLVIAIDASGSMYNFQLSETEREHWMAIALSRDEMERGEADAQDAIFWSGQTLADMQSVVRKPMTLAVDAIKEVLHSLQFGDKVAVIAFADSAVTLFSADDWQKSNEECIGRLDALLSEHLTTDIGSGTKLAQPLNMALQVIKNAVSPASVNRIIVISDGIVQDELNSNSTIETIKSDGFAISTIGIGDEFDEEFLMNVADSTRGGYHYAADIATITSELMNELVVIQSTAIRQLHIAAQGLSGTVVQDIYMARPNMTIFDEIDASDGWIRARVGDLPSDTATSLLVQVAPAKLEDGIRQIATVELSWQSMDSTNKANGEQQSESIAATYTTDPTLLGRSNTEVQQLVDRFKAYKLEREAQRAQQVGNVEMAREKLGAATRQLHDLGEHKLATDLEAEIANLGAANNDPTRPKRIKATTRRLGVSTASADSPTL